MQFRILGPLEVWHAQHPVELGGPRLRVLLGGLLLHANQVVTLGQLIEGLWEEAPPAKPETAVRMAVSRLRRLLEAGGNSAARVVTFQSGYELRVPPCQLDLEWFNELVAEARKKLAAGSGERAAEGLRAALRLWRGPALADVALGSAWRGQAAQLEEQRLAVQRERIGVELALGRHAELVGELTGLVAAHPLDERLRAQLMLALHGSGRQAKALEVYHDSRRVLLAELGLEPGEELRRAEQAILRNDPGLPAPQLATGLLAGRRTAVPAQLPADVAGFTGRERELAALLARLPASSPNGQAGTVAITAINGTAGIGKSALAIHAAHRLAVRFPDGQLYVNLQGATAGLEPLTPLEVLGRFLRALGVDGADVPAEAEEAAARFRSEVADRRLLVVLDNARDAAQVAPLLPASPGCGVLVTSRRTLSALDGITPLGLDALTPAEAVTLLGRLAGPQRVAAAPEAAAQVARWCGYRPLALRIAGARLAARPAWPVQELATRLADGQRRLDELELAAEIGVRASIAVSIDELFSSRDPVDRAAASTFGLLGMLDGPDVGVAVAARLLDAPEPAAERMLERLVDAQLLETPAPGRYRMHDLLRLYARERAAQQHPGPHRDAALTRALRLLVATTWHTLALLRPADYRLDRADPGWREGGLEFPDDQAALAWLETERANLLTAVQQAAATPGMLRIAALQLAHGLIGFFLVRSYWQDCVEVNRTALQIARQVGDRASQAQACNDLGAAHILLGRYEDALAYQQETLTIRRELGDRHGQAATLSNLGIIHERRSRYQEALGCQQDSLAILRELGDRRGQAATLGNLGVAYQRQGRYQEALACQQDSLAIFRELGDRAGLAESLNDLGVVYQRQQRHELALACQQESLAIRRELGDRRGQADSLRDLGVTLRARGRVDEARACLVEALGILKALQAPDIAEVRALLAAS
jgi:DNA-binding SARP family transcriptional activator/tetratricopeptide (TPR) repeat protein